jgi:prophage regulatory protein
MARAPPDIDCFLRERELLAITRLSRSTRWRLEKAGQFPQARRIGPHSVGYLKSEIMQWLVSREVASGQFRSGPGRPRKRDASEKLQAHGDGSNA